MNLNSIFLGSVPADQRKYLLVFCQYMKEKGYKKVVIPCVGQFGAAKVAIEAGFAPENILCSDISLFSSLLGYYFMKQRIPPELEFMLVKDHHREMYQKLGSDEDRIALLMVLMKMAQLREGVYYEKTFLEELQVRMPYYMEQMRKRLSEIAPTYRGIRYEVKDLRHYFYDYQWAEDEFMIMNPPAFTNGYTKMFNFARYIEYFPDVPEFNFNTEYMNMYVYSRTMPIPVLWHTSRGSNGFEKEGIIYGREYSIDKIGLWIINDPKYVADLDEKYVYVPKPKSKERVENFQLFDADADITPDVKVTIQEINKETALYYRDLFAHRLGATVAEIYFGIFLDGRLLSVCGFNTSFLRRLQENYIFENFCFSISHNKYENLNRMSMMMLVSGSFYQHLIHKTLANSAYVELKTFRTVCLTKFRKSKLNVGLLTLLSSERQPNGTYKLIYEQPFYMDRTYKDCIQLYLEKDARYKKGYIKALEMAKNTQDEQVSEV